MNLAVLNPAGWVAMQEKNLMLTTFGLIMLVVVPVIIMVFVFSWKYRASNTKAKYSPNWCHSTLLEIIWWAIPSVIIAILAYITWVSSHKLDPYRPLEHNSKPIEIQAVALDWKWLFFIPEFNIATVNYLEVPTNRPLNFKITADAPMNSFMVPQLGGQIYAMQGMETQIHLIANKEGTFDGYSSNYSGFGFSGMNFKIKAGTEEEFQQWIAKVQTNNKKLTKTHYYSHLLPPTKKHPIELYSSVERGLYKHIVDKYLMVHSHSQKMKHHNHHGHHKKYTQENHIRDVKENVAKYYEKTGLSHH